MKLTVIIPVFNEEKTIKKVLAEVLKQKIVSQIIIVDDGSQDKTRDILKKIRRQTSLQKLSVILHNTNQGKGAAIRTGLIYAKEDYIIIQDADLEYNPQEYRKLVESASEKTVVYGSRIIGNNPRAYWRTYFGNIIVTAFANLLFGTNLTDSYTCYKLIPLKIAKRLNLSSNGFEIEAEITGKLATLGVPIVEVPISYQPRSYEAGKKIKARDASKGILTFLKIRFQA